MTAPTQTSHQVNHISIPQELKNIHQKIQLYVDICYVNKMAFLISKSDSINFITIHHMKNKKKDTIIDLLNLLIKTYQSRGFTISYVFGDGEFDRVEIKTTILPSNLHICAAGEHVPRIERTIRTVKERARTLCHSLPYDSFPQLMTKSLLQNSTQ